MMKLTPSRLVIRPHFSPSWIITSARCCPPQSLIHRVHGDGIEVDPDIVDWLLDQTQGFRQEFLGFGIGNQVKVDG